MKTFISNPAFLLLSSFSMNSGFYKPGIAPIITGLESKLFPSLYNWDHSRTNKHGNCNIVRRTDERGSHGESSIHTLNSRRRKNTEDLTFENSTCLSSSQSSHNRQQKQQPKFQPKTKHQSDFLDLMRDNTVDIVIAIGPAGTGKTMLSCYAAVEALRNGNVNKIVVTRPVVSVDEEIGFLPGGLESKMDPWTRPIFDVLRETYSAKDIERMTEEGVIEIVPLGFMRGRTFKKSWIIADEMQNSSPTQMFMLATRIGEESKMIITGDLNQSDYNPKSNGLLEIYNKVCNSERTSSTAAGCVRYIELDKEDVQRSRAAKTILDIYETKPVSVEAKKSVRFSIPDSPTKQCAAPSSVSLENHQIPTLILRSGIVQNSTLSIEYDESNPFSNELEYFDVCLNQTDHVLPEDKNVGWVDIRDNDAALIPLKHVKQLCNFKDKQ